MGNLYLCIGGLDCAEAAFERFAASTVAVLIAASMAAAFFSGPFRRRRSIRPGIIVKVEGSGNEPGSGGGGGGSIEETPVTSKFTDDGLLLWWRLLLVLLLLLLLRLCRFMSSVSFKYYKKTKIKSQHNRSMITYSFEDTMHFFARNGIVREFTSIALHAVFRPGMKELTWKLAVKIMAWFVLLTVALVLNVVFANFHLLRWFHIVTELTIIALKGNRSDAHVPMLSTPNTHLHTTIFHEEFTQRRSMVVVEVHIRSKSGIVIVIASTSILPWRTIAIVVATIVIIVVVIVATSFVVSPSSALDGHRILLLIVSVHSWSIVSIWFLIDITRLNFRDIGHRWRCRLIIIRRCFTFRFCTRIRSCRCWCCWRGWICWVCGFRVFIRNVIRRIFSLAAILTSRQPYGTRHVILFAFVRLIRKSSSASKSSTLEEKCTWTRACLRTASYFVEFSVSIVAFFAAVASFAALFMFIPFILWSSWTVQARLT